MILGWWQDYLQQVLFSGDGSSLTRKSASARIESIAT
jgi:hypothetical protein